MRMLRQKRQRQVKLNRGLSAIPPFSCEAEHMDTHTRVCVCVWGARRCCSWFGLVCHIQSRCQSFGGCKQTSFRQQASNEQSTHNKRQQTRITRCQEYITANTNPPPAFWPSCDEDWMATTAASGEHSKGKEQKQEENEEEVPSAL